MSVREAMSSLAVGNFMDSSVVPDWMAQLHDFTDGLLEAASTINTLKTAYSTALNSPNAGEGIKAVEKTLNELREPVRTAFAMASEEAQNNVAKSIAESLERAIAQQRKNFIPPADYVERITTQEDEEIKRNEAFTAKGKLPDDTSMQQYSQAAKNNFDYADKQATAAPSTIKGVFINDQCFYSPAGRYYTGLVDKHKIKMGPPQVKIGGKGQYGTIAGKELTGKFVPTTGPLFLWLRKNGDLELVTGRHRYAKLMEDDDVDYHTCYVFIENEEHDDRWARRTDFEENMRDDEADERTAAYYIREYKRSDAELNKDGLLRSGSRSKRGILIGRYATENLYNMFLSGAVGPLKTEQICLLTMNIEDPQKRESLQSTAVKLIKQGKSLQEIQIQLSFLANHDGKIEQGLFNLGEDFTGSIETASQYVDLVLKNLEKGIDSIEAEIEKARDSVKRETTTNAGNTISSSQYNKEVLARLKDAHSMWKNFGSYPELVAQAFSWDKSTLPSFSQKISAQVAEEMQQQGVKTTADFVPEGQDAFNFSASLSIDSLADRVQRVLQGSANDAIGAAVSQEWTKLINDFNLWSVDNSPTSESEAKAGNIMGTMLATLTATYKFLPQQYKKGSAGLDMQRKWLSWYADMFQNGTISKSSTLSGKLYDDALARLTATSAEYAEKYSKEDAQDFLKEYAGKKAVTILASVAAKCRKMLDNYLKDSMRDSMLAQIKALYPQKQFPGDKIPKGKATADTYRYAQMVKKALSFQSIAPSSNQATQDRIDAINQKLANHNLSPKQREKYENLRLSELEQFQDQLNEEIQKQQGIIDSPESSDDEKDEARSLINIYMTFSGWNFKSLNEAQAAFAQFNNIIIQGRKQWQDMQEERKQEIRNIIAHVRYNRLESKDKNGNPTPAKLNPNWLLAPETTNKLTEEKAFKSRNIKALNKTIFSSYTSLVGKLNMARKILGTWFVSKYTSAIADMHTSLKAKQDEELNWLYRELSIASGKRSIEGICDYVRQNEIIRDTGIKLNLVNRTVYQLTKDEIDKLTALSPEEREARRNDARRDKKKNPPEEILQELRNELANDLLSQAASGRQYAPRKYYIATSEETNPTSIKSTKWGVLNAILTAEQPYYAHLLQDNGINADTLDQMRTYVGKELIEFGYRMRAHLAEIRPFVSDRHERIYGIPFPQHDLYFPASFQTQGSSGGADEAGQVTISNKSGLPGRPDSMRTRTIHYRRIDWGVSALDKFISTVRQENNWLITGDFIADFASLLSDREFGVEMRANLGDIYLSYLKQDLRTLANATLGDVNLTAINKAVSLLCKTLAFTALGYNPITVAKNFTSILNGWKGGSIPTEYERDAKSGIALALEERGVGLLEYLCGGSGEFSRKEIVEQLFIRTRKMNPSKRILGQASEDAKKEGIGTKLRHTLNPIEMVGIKTQEIGMKPIEVADVEGNIISALWLANATYRALSKNPAMNGLTREEKRAWSLKSAQKALDYVAQPIISSQKVTAVSTKGIGGAFADFSLYMFKSEQMASFSKALADMIGGETIGQRLGGANFFLVKGLSAWLLGEAVKYGLGAAWALLSGDEQEALYEDYEDFWANFFAYGLGGELSSVPLVGPGLEGLVHLAAGKRAYTQNFFAAVWSKAIKTFRAYDGGETAEQIRGTCDMLKYAGYASALSYAVPSCSGILELWLAICGAQNLPKNIADRFAEK